MTTIVSNSGHDERGKWSGGAAGDQSGTEWYLCPWFDFGQRYVLRHPAKEARELLATLAREAAGNDRIGYDQDDRLSFYRALARSDWRPSRIREDVESDCSAGVTALVIATGHILRYSRLAELDPSTTTYVMLDRFRAAGFQVVTDFNKDTVLIGDICLKPSQHVNLVVSSPRSDTGLVVDGYLGYYSVSEWQYQLGTICDGIVSGQWRGNAPFLERLVAIEWSDTGRSELVQAIQRRVDVIIDGYIGHDTVLGIQRYLNRYGYGLLEDGRLGEYTARAIQRSLNRGDIWR